MGYPVKLQKHVLVAHRAAGFVGIPVETNMRFRIVANGVDRVIGHWLDSVRVVPER